jgi:hypothetical protein
MQEHVLKVSEPKLHDAVVLSLHDNGLVLVRADSRCMDEGYDPTLALAQSLSRRITDMRAAIQIVEIGNR